MNKNYKDILGEAYDLLDTTESGNDNERRKGIGKAITALGMVVGDIGYKVDKLNDNLEEFDRKSEKSAMLIGRWTILMALVATLNVWVTANWWPVSILNNNLEVDYSNHVKAKIFDECFDYYANNIDKGRSMDAQSTEVCLEKANRIMMNVSTKNPNP